MPELPEVETVRRGLQPVFEASRIERLEARRPDLRFPFPIDLAKRLEGRTVTDVTRRAKYLLFHTASNGPVLIAHLGMSGSFRIELDEASETPGTFHIARSKDAKHDHVVFHLQLADRSRRRVIFNDPRRFGFMLIAEPGELDTHPMLSGLGVEPLGNELDGELLSRLLRGRKAPLKAALLDQRGIAGLGNIYVCEALWRSRLSPKRSATSITRAKGSASPRVNALAAAIRSVLTDAVEAGGSSLRDHRQADGSLGYFQHRFAVYDREGKPCRHEDCDGTIRRVVQSGRSTFYCPRCQR